MHIQLTDGTRAVDIRTPDDAALSDVEATALRLYAALTETEHDEQDKTAFGYGRDLQGVALDSATERAEQHDEPDLDDEVTSDAGTVGRQHTP